MTVVGIVFGDLIVRIMMKDMKSVLIIPKRKIQRRYVYDKKF